MPILPLNNSTASLYDKDNKDINSNVYTNIDTQLLFQMKIDEFRKDIENYKQKSQISNKPAEFNNKHTKRNNGKNK